MNPIFIRYVHHTMTLQHVDAVSEGGGPGRYLGLQVLHGLLEGLGRSSLVVTEDGHRPVGPVVGQDLPGEVVLGCSTRDENNSVNVRAENIGHPGRILVCVWSLSRYLVFYLLGYVKFR